MRWRLATAVRVLLKDPSVSGLPDVARLAAVVLFAKSSAGNGRTRIWAAELGRWLGVSESMVDHAVLPSLRASKAVRSRVITDVSGQVTGLECAVMPAWRAKQQAEKEGGVAQPLALSRRELATLLRLCEALFGPGWAPAHRTATPPGLLAERRGRGAATDRLGFLLMVLETRADGWLRLCGGSVEGRRGRAATTVARALGCSASAGGKVLERLQKRGVVEVVRKETESGLKGSSRVRIAAVAAAHGRDRAVASSRSAATGSHKLAGSPRREQRRPVPAARQGAPGGLDSCSEKSLAAISAGSPAEPRAGVLSDLPVTAPGDLDPGADTDSLAGAGDRQSHWPQHSAESDPPVAAPLHASHPSVAHLSGESECGCSFSGAAVRGVTAVGRDARTRAKVATTASTTAGIDATAADALRAEKTKPPRLSQRPDYLTIRYDVNRVLQAIAPVRARLVGGQLRVAQAAIGAVLRVMPLSSLVSHLETRLAPISFEVVAGQAPEMRSPLGWLLSQLPKVSLCPRCNRTFNGPRAGVALCGSCSVSAGEVRHLGWCDDCGQQRSLDANRLCERCHSVRVNLTICGSCGSRAHVDVITGFCGDCECWLREFCSPELAGLNADGQKLALRLLRGADTEAPRQRPATQVSSTKTTPRWQQHWREWAERPLPEDQTELTPQPVG